MSEIESIIRGLTKPQRAVLDRLAMGQSQGTNTRVLKALESKGLIVGYERSARDRFTWTDYAIPVIVHIAWAAACSAEFDALSPEERAAAEAPGE